jgi:hypothetical protein
MEMEMRTEATARNIRVQNRYDELMTIGKHGHYETMFQVVREETESLRQQLADSQKQVTLLRDALVTIRDEPIETDEHDGIEPHVVASEALAATEEN